MIKLTKNLDKFKECLDFCKANPDKYNQKIWGFAEENEKHCFGGWLAIHNDFWEDRDHITENIAKFLTDIPIIGFCKEPLLTIMYICDSERTLSEIEDFYNKL